MGVTALVACTGLGTRARGYDPAQPLAVHGLTPGLSRAEVLERAGSPQLQRKSSWDYGRKCRVLFLGDRAGTISGDSLSQHGQTLLAVGDDESRVRALLGQPSSSSQTWPLQSRLASGNHYWCYPHSIYVEFEQDRVRGFYLGS